jgi:hypothetical protein
VRLVKENEKLPLIQTKQHLVILITTSRPSCLLHGGTEQFSSEFTFMPAIPRNQVSRAGKNPPKSPLFIPIILHIFEPSRSKAFHNPPQMLCSTPATASLLVAQWEIGVPDD